MTEKILYLHMGFHKTGTTSLQKYFQENIINLKDQGYSYPIFENYKKKDITNHSIPLYSLFTENPKLYHINKKWGLCENIKNVNENYNNYLDTFLKNNNRVIISGEDISNLCEKSLDKLKFYFTDKGFTIIPIVVVRSPYSNLCSIYQELIKGGKYINFNKKYNCMLKEKILKIKKIFPNTIFISYSKTLEHSFGSVGKVSEVIGVDITNFKKINLTNVGLNNKTIRYINKLNKENPRFIEGKLNKNYKRFHTNLKDDNNKFYLKKSEKLNVIDKIKEENEFLLNTFDIDFCDKEFPTYD
jgi:hypothetical protein